jgi:hypothetical protein
LEDRAVDAVAFDVSVSSTMLVVLTKGRGARESQSDKQDG